MTSSPPPGRQGPLWGAANTGGPVLAAGGPDRGGSGGPQLEPLSRRLLEIAALLAVLVIAVVANAVFHDGGVDQAINPIAEAAVRTQSLPGYSGSLEVIYSTTNGAPPVVANGEIAVNARAELARGTLSVPTPSGQVRVESVADETHVFVRSSAFSSQLPAGAEWIEIEPFLGQEAPGFAGGDSGSSQLEMLRATADVKSLGVERVHGVSLHRYQTTIDLGHLADLVEAEGNDLLAKEYRNLDEASPEPIRAEAWITGKGVLRQERVVSTMASDDGRPPVRMDMRIEVDKLGVAPRIQLPDPSTVYNATPALREHLQGLGTES